MYDTYKEKVYYIQRKSTIHTKKKYNTYKEKVQYIQE